MRLLPVLSRVVALTLAIATHVVNAGGETDTSFSPVSGKYAFRIESSISNNAKAIAAQPDGKIVMLGTCGSGNGFDNDFCVARLTSAGVLDSSFVGPNGNSDGRFLLPIGLVSDLGTAIALQPDGKILLAGSCNGNTNDDFCLARLNPNGSLDTAFNGPNNSGNGEGTGGGKFLLPIGTHHDTLAAIALQPDGKIVVAGSCSDTVKRSFCIARLNSNGTFDHSFISPTGSGASGRFSLRIGEGLASEDVAALAIQPTGEILMVGTCDSGATALDFCAARLLQGGTFDVDFDGGDDFNVFNGNGKFIVVVPFGFRNDVAASVVIRNNGDAIIAGSCYNGTNFDFCARRIDHRGRSLANETGSPGTQIRIGSGDNLLTSISLQHDGKFALVGQCQNGVNYQFCAARFNGDFTLDLSFDGDDGTGNGKFRVPLLLSSDRANAGAIHSFSNRELSDDGLLIAGTCRLGTIDHFCITRLTYGERLAPRCHIDIDGDGRTVATTDGLMMTRILLGMRGNAVSEGIVFPVHARRKTWSSIRTFLVTQCGLSLPI